MHIEVRVEALTSRWRELISEWREARADVAVSGAMGSVVALFRDPSPEYMAFRELLRRREQEWSIRIRESRRAVYERAEKETAELLVLFPPMLEMGDTPRERCERCRKWLARGGSGGSVVLNGGTYSRYQFFVTQRRDVLCGQELRGALESALQGSSRFWPAIEPSGQPSERYFIADVPRGLGVRRSAEGPVLTCPACGQWDARGGELPPVLAYERGSWNGAELLWTADVPPLLCAVPRLVEVIHQFEPEQSIDQSLPLTLE